jgi:hypothetical protein
VIQYKVELDITRTGLFDHPLADITNRVRDSISFSTGYQSGSQIVNNAMALVAPSNSMQITLDNRDGAFNYDSLGSNGITGADFHNLIAQSIMLRLSMTYDGITHSYIFYTNNISVPIGQYGQQIAIVTANDVAHRLQAIRYEPPVEQSKRTSDAILDFFKNADIFLPYSSDFFILDVSKLTPDVGILGGLPIVNPQDTINRKLYDADTNVNDFVEVETGVGILDYVGDNIREIVEDHQLRNNGLAYVYDVCMGEAFGRLYFNPRDNKFHFHNRHHDINTNSSLLLTSHDIIDVNIRQSTVANDVRIFFTPRELGDAGEIIFSAVGSEMVRLRAGQTLDVGVQYRDPNNRRDAITALFFTEPVVGTDVIVLNESDQVVTGSVYRGAELNGTGGKIMFANRLNETVRVTKLQVRGRPIYMNDQQYARATDGVSVFFHNHIPLPNVTINYCFDQEFAQSVADFMIRQYGTMRRTAESVTVMLREDNFIDIMGVDIGDGITLYDEDSNHTSDYIIMGERHEIDIASGAHRMSYVLRSKDTVAYFALDRDELDNQDVILAY